MLSIEPRFLVPFFVALAAVSTTAQDEIRVDVGSSTLLTSLTGWNDIHPGNIAAGLDLVTSTGAASGVRIDADPAMRLLGSNESGTPSPLGALAALGWPSTVYGDTMWNDSNTPEAVFTFSGLDPTSSYDLTLTASRVGVNDVRTGVYTVSGFNSAGGVLDAANNQANVLVLSGIVPDLSQEITLHLQADITNTNPNGYYYLNGVELDENAGGASGPLLGFAANPLVFSRAQGKGPFSTEFSIDTYDGAMPSVSLTVVDDQTGIAPTWLSLPASPTAGVPFTLTVDETVLAAGTYSATLTGQAAGYPDAVSQVQFTVRAAGGPLNLLYYGNSYSQYNGTVPTVVKALAEEAGLPSPNTVPRLVGGQNLFYHLTNPTQAAAIAGSLPLGEEWDFVVIQGFSTEATSIGDPAAFLANAESIVENVKAHSQSTKAVFYQTWARAPGHSFYPFSFSGPLEMHREIEASYTQAAAIMNARWGPDTARRAPAGEAASLYNFGLFLYCPDLSHPDPPLTLMASMAIFQELYQFPVCGVSPDFNGSSSLAGWLSTYGIDEAQWDRLVGVAARVGMDRLRSYAGSGDDLLLRSGPTGSILNVCPELAITSGASIDISMQTPNETLVGSAAFLYLQAYPHSGAIAPQSMFPELYLDPARATVLLSLGTLTSGLQTASFNVPLRLAGVRLLVQGYSTATSYQTGASFTTTDAHEFTLAPGHVLLAPPPAPR